MTKIQAYGSQQAAILPTSAEENKRRLFYDRIDCWIKWRISGGKKSLSRSILVQDILFKVKQKVFKPQVICFSSRLIIEHHHGNPFHLVEINTA